MKPNSSTASLTHRRQAQALRDNVQRILRVSELVSSARPGTRATKGKVAESAGISRSTLTRLTRAPTSNSSGTGENGAANPDLDTLCRLAATLNIPPAFLLMTPQDWNRLLSALDVIRHVDQLKGLLPDLRTVGPDELTLAADAMAAELNRTTPPHGIGLQDSRLMRRAQKRAEQGVRAMVSSIDWRHVTGSREALFLVAVQMGFTTNLEDE